MSAKKPKKGKGMGEDGRPMTTAEIIAEKQFGGLPAKEIERIAAITDRDQRIIETKLAHEALKKENIQPQSNRREAAPKALSQEDQELRKWVLRAHDVARKPEYLDKSGKNVASGANKIIEAEQEEKTRKEKGPAGSITRDAKVQADAAKAARQKEREKEQQEREDRERRNQPKGTTPTKVSPITSRNGSPPSGSRTSSGKKMP